MLLPTFGSVNLNVTSWVPDGDIIQARQALPQETRLLMSVLWGLTCLTPRPTPLFSGPNRILIVFTPEDPEYRMNICRAWGTVSFWLNYLMKYLLCEIIINLHAFASEMNLIGKSGFLFEASQPAPCNGSGGTLVLNQIMLVISYFCVHY